ncbi:MAG: hypothetical protein ABIH49_01445 [archaeon]
MKNKKGDLPTLILVVGVFAVCALALASFYFADVDFRDSLAGIQMIEKINSFGEEINFHLALGKNPADMMEIFNGVSEGNIFYSGKLNEGVYVVDGNYSLPKNKIFGFGFGGEKRIIYVEYKLP